MERPIGGDLHCLPDHLRRWKGDAVKRVLFLADRNIRIDQTKANDFQPFGGGIVAMARSLLFFATLDTAVYGAGTTCARPSTP